jgi:hypothetical protein
MDETTIDQEIADMFGDIPDTDPVETDTSESTETDTSDNSSENTENTDASSPSEEADTNNNSENTADSEGDKDPAEDKQQDKQSDQAFSAEDKFTNKQNKAFAEMRVQNKEYEQFLMRMAQIAKLDVKNAKEAKEVLAARLTQTEAKQKQMDPQVLAELEDSRKQIAEMRQARIKEQALSGFAKLKTLHGLSDTDLNNFADELVAKNKNPFEQEMDLVSEYRLANFDKLMEKAREEGRLAEIARSKKAQQSGSNPGTQRSTPENTGGSEKSLKNVGDLDNFFKELGI